MLLIIIWYFFLNYFWPRPRPHSFGLGLEVLDSFNITNSRISHSFFYHAMHFSAKRGIAIACRLSVCPSVCNVDEL